MLLNPPAQNLIILLLLASVKWILRREGGFWGGQGYLAVLGNNATIMLSRHAPHDANSQVTEGPATCWGAVLGLLFSTLLPLSARAMDVSPAQQYLTQAGKTTRQIELGGDQSAARREIALALVKLDEAAVKTALAGIGRPSDAARVVAAIVAAEAVKHPKPVSQPAAKETKEAPKAVAPGAKEASPPTGKGAKGVSLAPLKGPKETTPPAAMGVEETTLSAAMGGRLLQRLTSPERRAQEGRSYLQEIAALGEEAPAAVPDVPEEEARALVVASLAATNPEQALALLKEVGFSRDRLRIRRSPCWRHGWRRSSPRRRWR